MKLTNLAELFARPLEVLVSRQALKLVVALILGMACAYYGQEVVESKRAAWWVGSLGMALQLLYWQLLDAD